MAFSLRPATAAARRALIRPIRQFALTRTYSSGPVSPPPEGELAVGELQGIKFRVAPIKRVGENDDTKRARLLCRCSPPSYTFLPLLMFNTNFSYSTKRPIPKKRHPRIRPPPLNICKIPPPLHDNRPPLRIRPAPRRKRLGHILLGHAARSLRVVYLYQSLCGE